MLDPTDIAPHSVVGLAFCDAELVPDTGRLRDPELPTYGKIAVIVFAGLLVGYAIGVGGFALNEALGEAETEPME